MSSKHVVTLRLNDSELKILNDFTEKLNQSKSDFIRNLIMTTDSNSKDKLSIEILQRIYTLTQIVLGTMKDIVPGKVTQSWIDEIINESKKRYPME